MYEQAVLVTSQIVEQKKFDDIMGDRAREAAFNRTQVVYPSLSFFNPIYN